MDSERAGYVVTRRDRLAHWMATQALRIATPEYRAFIAVTPRGGCEALLVEALRLPEAAFDDN